MVVAGWIVIPGASIGTMNMLIPACAASHPACSRREEHVFPPPGRRPDLLSVDNPRVVGTHRAGPQRREIDPAWVHCSHAVHGLTRRISGRYFRCCSGVPNIISALAWIAAPIRGASPRSMVSMNAICSSGERA